jgi:hypothetical protein
VANILLDRPLRAAFGFGLDTDDMTTVEAEAEAGD